MIEYTDWETGETKRLVERVDVLEQQRDELLDALKRSKYMNTTAEDWRFIQDAITRAEAAE